MSEELEPVAAPESPASGVIATPEPKPSLVERTEAEIHAWFNEHFHNHGPALPDALFNHFRAAKEKLVERLHALFAEEG